MPDPTNPYAKIAGVIADMLAQDAEPIISGRPMHRATMCELVDAIRDQAIVVGMNKVMYQPNDPTTVAQVAKVAALVEHLKERMECA